MSTTPGPTFSSPMLTSEQLTIVSASFASLLFFVVIVVMLSIIYRKDPHCCKPRYQASLSDMASPPQYYSSRQTLVGSPCEQTHIPDDDTQSGQLFYVGLPSSYSLEAPMPRLPSYESVRKKDRQRHIHKMIADRFGLSGSMVGEPPPSYEESMEHSVEIPYNSNQSCANIPDPHMTFINSGFNNQSDDPPAADANTDTGSLPL